MELKFQVQIKISKPIDEVFDSVIDPKKLSGYFTRTATPMKEGGAAVWTFSEYPGEIPVTVRKIVPNKLIALEWEAQDGGYNTQIEIRFETIDAKSTLVKISESGWRENQKGLDSSYSNCQGWMHMSCCLKAFLEYGINLRQGSF